MNLKLDWQNGKKLRANHYHNFEMGQKKLV